MKRLLLGALLAAVATSAPASDLSLRKVLEAAKSQPGARVFLIYTRGDSWEGSLVEVGADLFCIQRDAGPRGEKRPQVCIPLSAVSQINRPDTAAPADFTTIWISGPN